ncbi:MAG TPA: hypothetical protein IAC17_08025 [Candidatus Faecousia faecipullorum]|nr:hypothetical protein [Candidatus Faecousia faecipullorum]
MRQSENQFLRDASYAMEILLLRQLRDLGAISEDDYHGIRRFIFRQLHAEIYLE